MQEIESQSGNARLVAAFENLEALRTAWSDWHAAAREIERRMEEWTTLETLVSRGASLPEVAAVKEHMIAIETGRSLLADPDPVRPLVQQVSDAIRAAVQARLADYKTAREEGVAELQAEEAFKQLPDETWKRIITKHGLGPLPSVELGSVPELLAELDVRPLGMWQDLIAGMRSRVDAAREDLAKAVAPKTTTYTPPARRLTTPAEVDAYVEEIKAALLAAIKDGNPVIVQR